MKPLEILITPSYESNSEIQLNFLEDDDYDGIICLSGTMKTPNAP
jgi:hypothetical protein